MPEEIANLADTVHRAAQRNPDAPALIRNGRTLTWAELDAAVEAVARGLTALSLAPTVTGAGVTVPARVAIATPNVPEFAIAYFAALRAGLVAVPINPGYTAPELLHLLGDSGASVLVATGAVLEAVETIRPELGALAHTYSIDLDFADLHRDGGPVAPVGRGEDLAVLMYTSGTAGKPRGAMLSHRALIANHEQLAQIRPEIIRGQDVVLLALPLSHAFGLNSGLGAVAWHGACGVLVDQFDPAGSLATIASRRVTVVAAVPQMYTSWAMRPELTESTRSVRLAVSGAAPLDPITEKRFLDATRQPVYQGYGLTEAAPVVTTAIASPVLKTGSIGRPVPGVELKLQGGDGVEIARVGPDGLAVALSDDDSADDAPGTPGTDPGQIVVRGANLFSGYWPDGRDGPDADGWWATGDIGYADGDGDLYLVDRLGELILVSGFNVYPHEVELVIASHPGVAETAVIGLPDPTTGETVKAYVVPAAGAHLTVEQVAAFCAQSLARFKCPSIIEFVDELPHSATGKVRKGELR